MSASGFQLPTTRDEVLARDGSRCWLCLNTNPAGLHLAHQISGSAPERFAYYSLLGVLSPLLDYPDHPDNLITLCGVCHPSYDADHPYWVMVPDSATLTRYITHERADYDSRLRAASRGRYQERTLPVIDRTSVRYHPCILELEMARGLGTTNISIAEWPKAWLGDPIAALIKAAAGLCQPCKEFKVMHSLTENITLGVPKTLKHKSRQLLDLWCREDPAVQQRAPPPPGGRVTGKGSREWRHRENFRRRVRRGQRERHSTREDGPANQDLQLSPEAQAGQDLVGQDEPPQLELDGLFALGPGAIENGVIEGLPQHQAEWVPWEGLE